MNNRLPPEERITQSLDESVEHLDAATLSRLNQARHNALQQTPSRSWRMLPYAVAASCGVLVITLLMQPKQLQTPFETDYELSLIQEDLEMIEQLDMLEWMSVTETAYES